MVFPIAGGNESKGYEVENSLRFNDGDSAKLALAFGSGGNTKIWTVSCWFKRGILSSRQSFLNVGSSGSEYMSLYIDSDDKLYWVTESGGNTYRIGSSAKFRDPSAWYHVVVTVDVSNSTSADRLRLYVNGVRLSTVSYTAPTAGILTKALEHRIGLSNGTSHPLGAYLADVYLSLIHI